MSVGPCPKVEFDFASFIQQHGSSLNPFTSVTEVYLGQQDELEKTLNDLKTMRRELERAPRDERK